MSNAPEILIYDLSAVARVLPGITVELLRKLWQAACVDAAITLRRMGQSSVPFFRPQKVELLKYKGRITVLSKDGEAYPRLPDDYVFSLEDEPVAVVGEPIQ